MTDTLHEHLVEAQWQNIAFPVVDLTTNGARSHAAHMAYRRAGADLEDTGLEPYAGSMTIPFLNTSDLVERYGTLYPDLRDRVIAKFEQDDVGRLVHPQRGPIDAMIVAWSERLDAKNRGGSIVTVQFLEHNGSSLILLAEDSSVPQDYEDVASDQASNADAAMASYDANNAGGWTATTPTVSTQLQVLATASTFAAIDGAIRTMQSIVAQNIALSVFASPDAHAVVASLYTLQATLVRLRNRALGQLLYARTITTPRQMAAWEIAQQQYGDASLDLLILQSNSFEDSLAIPAGATVLIPPAP